MAVQHKFSRGKNKRFFSIIIYWYAHDGRLGKGKLISCPPKFGKIDRDVCTLHESCTCNRVLILIVLKTVIFYHIIILHRENARKTCSLIEISSSAELPFPATQVVHSFIRSPEIEEKKRAYKMNHRFDHVSCVHQFIAECLIAL